MKTHIRDVSQRQSGDDIESVLEVLLGDWAEIDDRWSSRLQSIFSAADADGDGNLDMQEYYDMLEKVSSFGSRRRL